MKTLLILLLIFSNVALADDPVYLPKGTAAPFTGYLIDQSKADKIRLLSIDYQEATKTRDYLQQDNAIFVKRVDNLTQENDKLAKANTELRENGIWGKVGLFVLGCAVTTGVAFAVSRTIR